MRIPRGHRLVVVAMGLLALVGVPAFAHGATGDWVVVLEDGQDGTRLAAVEERRGNDVAEVFPGRVEGFVAELDAADAARLRDDPRVAIVEREDAEPPVDTSRYEDPADAGLAVGDAIRHRYIARLAPSADRGALLRRLGIRPDETYTAALNGFAAWLDGEELRALAADPAVLDLEADVVVGVDAVQKPVTWGLDRIDQRVAALDSRYVYSTTGAGVTVYVLDTGVYAGHSEFTGRVTGGATAIADGLGSADCHGHGTHVAGTVAGARYGVAKGATIIPVRVLGCSGSGSLSGVIAGVDWVVLHHPASQPAVANMSLGSSAYSLLNQAVERGVADGVTFVVSAGNNGNREGYSPNACDYSPASTPVAITVGSTTSADTRSDFSNYGTCVDIFAPGSNIRSAGITSRTSSVVMSGTSMASPHVAGAAALYLEANPLSTPAQVTTALTSAATASAITDPGTGSPNLLLLTRDPAVTVTATVPGAPFDLRGTSGTDSASLTWEAPIDSGDSTLLDYVLQQSDDSGTWQTIDDGVSTAGAFVAAGLTPGQTYRFRVAAVSDLGQGAWATTGDVVIAATPPPPPTPSESELAPSPKPNPTPDPSTQPPAPEQPRTIEETPAAPAAPQVLKVRRVAQGLAVELVLKGEPGTKYRIYRGKRMVLFTADRTPRLRLPANGRAVFRVVAVGPGGASAFSNRVIVTPSRIRFVA